MPKISEKKKFLKCYTEIALQELCLLNGENENKNRIDEILDDLALVLCAADIHRYFTRFVHGSVAKSKYFMCEILPNLEEERFKQFMRVSKEKFQKILELIKEDQAFSGAKSGKQFPVEMQLAVVLYRLGSYGEGASIVKIAALFGIGDGGTIQILTERIFKALLKLKDKYLYWPSSSERKNLAESTAHELPHCIGYVDGSEIKLAEKPMQDPEAYFSRKHVYSIKVQVVCDYKLRIRHLVTGYPGSVHDARIFNNCDLAMKPDSFFSGMEWIAGDSAYKLTSTVLTPFRTTGSNAASQRCKIFNKSFSRYRVRVEHCFMHLKERFGSLKELKIAIKDDSCTKKACLWIMVCAILHNIIIDEDESDAWSIQDTVSSQESAEVEYRGSCSLQGEAKRLQVLDSLNFSEL